VWEHIIGTNLKSVWLGMRSVIPHMIAAGGGRIVNTSLMSAQRGSRATAAVKPRPLGSCRPPAAVFLGAVLGGALGCASAFVIGRAEHPIGGMPARCCTSAPIPGVIFRARRRKGQSRITVVSTLTCDGTAARSSPPPDRQR
jgi:hypothetical protein